MLERRTAVMIAAPADDEQWRRYYRLRWQLLRAPWGQPLGTERDEDEARAWHWGAWSPRGEALGCVRLQAEADGPGRLRYMAVLPAWRGHGIGRRLVEAVESKAVAEGFNQLVLDARQPAVAFYRALGFLVDARSYPLFGTINHWRMSKVLER